MRTVHWHNTPRAPVLPSGVVVPDLGVKRSLVLDRYVSQRQAERSAAIQRDRLKQQQQNAQRSYAGAATNRLTGDWMAMNTSADSELLTSGRILRARSRELVRDNEYALHCVRLFQNNVIGNGIGIQAQVKTAGGKLITKINDSIEQGFSDWWGCAASCHTAGVLAGSDIERVNIAETITAGEMLLRLVRQPFGRNNEIPLAIELIEADRLLDNWQTARAPNGNAIRMGVEIDQWHRPVAYWFSPQHPGDYQFTTFEPSRFMRVPAEDIIHSHIVNRWPQTRGEPWFHAALRGLNDVGSYEEATIVKARASANVVGFISGPELLTPDDVKAGRDIINTEPGTWQRLLPGESVSGFNATTPDPAVEGFLRHMIRKMGVGVGLSYEALSRDLTGASYSSARVGLLDDRDLYRILQGFVIRNIRQRIHAEFMDAAVLVGKVKTGNDYFSNSAKYQAVRFKPRGWSWIDPQKEVNAYKTAVRSGFMSVQDVISETNNSVDVEDVWKEIKQEHELAEELDLVFDTDAAQVNDKGQAQAAAAPPDGAEPAEPAGAAGGGTADGDEPPAEPGTQE